MDARFSIRLRALRRDRSGAIAVTTALVSGVLFVIAALTIDASRLYLLKRRQQTVTDLAAIGAAANIANATAAATANLVANGLPAANLAAVEPGIYTADPGVAASQRFVAGPAATANAVRVTLTSSATTFFGRFASALGPSTIGTRSIAANASEATFAIGSDVANLQGGLANAILGGLTGSSLSLSAGDYAGLASANVDLFGVSNALAARLRLSGSYASLAATTVRVSDVLNAVADAGSAGGMPSSAVATLRAIATAIGPSGPTFMFGNLVGFGAYGNLAVGSPPPIAAQLAVLPLLSAAARLGGGTGEVTVNVGASTAPLLSVVVKIAFAQAMAGSSYAAVGPVGTTLHTAQIRILMLLHLASFGSIAGLNLPLYLDVAPATATSSAIGCSGGLPVDPAVTLSVSPGLVDGWIANVTDGDMTSSAPVTNPNPAILTNLGLVAISGRAHATVSNLNPTAVPFTAAAIAAGKMQTTSTTDYISSLLSQLFASLQLGASIGGLTVTLPPGVSSGIASLLQADLLPIDQELSSTLALLGITIGNADTWVRGVRRGQGMMVN